jgi:hypothetical protein
MIAEYAGTTNHAGLSMGVFFSFCFISFYGGGIDVVGYVYCCKYSPIFFPAFSMHDASCTQCCLPTEDVVRRSRQRSTSPTSGRPWPSCTP